MFWFHFVEKNFDTTIEISTYKDITTTTFSALSYDWILNSKRLTGFYRSLLFLDLTDDDIWVWCKDSTSNKSIMCFYSFPEIISISANGREF
ncbi:hypothetical protein C0J52_26942 [Blattella germanica]|nr:hypothetical protein C0J52_26942 [Blattella germanica]